MWVILVFLSLSLMASEDLKLDFDELESELPEYNLKNTIIDQTTSIDRVKKKYDPPVKIIYLEPIKKSETGVGAIKPGSPIVRISDNKTLTISKSIFVKYYLKEDEFGFKYLVSKNDENKFKIDSSYLFPIDKVSELSEGPKYFQTYSSKIEDEFYDSELNWGLSLGLYSGISQGQYIKDILNTASTPSGLSSQFEMGANIKWKYPILPGIVTHYQRVDFKLSSGRSANYESLSLGPQVKTQNFSLFDYQFRFQFQGRLGAFSKLVADLGKTQTEFNFNSTDILFSLEFPHKNQFGEFVLGFFVNNQWLNLKDQTEIVKVNPSNKTNTTFGLQISQVIE